MGNRISFNVAGEQYIIKDELGSGQYGKAFLITRQGVNYTLKIFYGNEAFQEELANLRTLYRVLNGTCNPHIQCFKDVFLVEPSNKSYEEIWQTLRLPMDRFGQSLNCIISKYVEGVNLRTVIWKGKYDDSLAKSFLNQILPVVQLLHHHNIVHRDLKPENLIYSRSNNFTLIDFGLSCVESCNGVAGTAGYIHQDVFRKGSLENYKKSDVFACGVILYEILSHGKDPFQGDQYQSIYTTDDLQKILSLLLFKPELGIDFMVETWESLNSEWVTEF